MVRTVILKEKEFGILRINERQVLEIISNRSSLEFINGVVLPEGQVYSG